MKDKPECFGNFTAANMFCIGCESSVECGDVKTKQVVQCTCGTCLACRESSGTMLKAPGIKTAPKDNAKEGKSRASLIPWDVLIEFLTPAYEEGVIKYVRESWRQGFKISVCMDAVQRHLKAFFYDHEDYDPDAAELGVKKHHLAGAMFYMMAMLWTLKTRPELDDRPVHNVFNSTQLCDTCSIICSCKHRTPMNNCKDYIKEIKPK